MDVIQTVILKITCNEIKREDLKKSKEKNLILIVPDKVSIIKVEMLTYDLISH